MQEHFNIQADTSGLRLDSFLAGKINTLSRSRIQQIVKGYGVSVNQRLVKRPGHKISEGDVISFTVPDPTPVSIQPLAIPLEIIHEDSHIVVVNKRAGMVVHPGAGKEGETLVHALLHHCDDLSGIGGEIRPGIVHRLDKDTSGIIICAKNDAAHEFLAAQFRKRLVSKTYHAIVTGQMNDSRGRIELPLGRHPIHRKRMAVNAQNGKPAVTDWCIKKRLNAGSLLELHIYTGRTHQIRVHMQFIGHPVMGDLLYGGQSRVILAKEDVVIKRQMLHASNLVITHPATGEQMVFDAPLPPDMMELITRLG